MSFHNIKTIFLVIIIINIIVKHVNTQPNIKRSDLFCVLSYDKIYFAGGINSQEILTDDFFYLDLNISFNTKPPNSLPFREAQKSPFKHRDSALISSNNDTIYLFVGTKDNGDDNLVYEYNQNSNEWKPIPKNGFTLPKTFAKVQAIKDEIHDIVYLYGKETEFKMYIYNLTTNSWNITTSPYNLSLTTAVMVENEIYYIGGSDQIMNKVIMMIFIL